MVEWGWREWRWWSGDRGSDCGGSRTGLTSDGGSGGTGYVGSVKEGTGNEVGMDIGQRGNGWSVNGDSSNGGNGNGCYGNGWRVNGDSSNGGNGN